MSSTDAALSPPAALSHLRLVPAQGDAALCAPPAVGIVDRDHVFVGALCEAMSAGGWRLRRLPALPSRRALGTDSLVALLIDVAIVDRSELTALASAQRPSSVAIIACAEDSTVAERVQGLQAGLDGWIEKPCAPEEALARVQAIVRGRNTGTRVARKPLRSGELEVRQDRFDALAGGNAADLTTREYEVLELLIRHEHVVLSREQIYEAIWGYEMLAGDRVVDIFVSRIRRKLARISPAWEYLHTHPGHGYRFAARPGAQPVAPDRLRHAVEVGDIQSSPSDPDEALAAV